MNDTDYAWKMVGQSWSNDTYYVGSSYPYQKVEVVASTRQEAINEAARMLGNAGNGRHWRFFDIKARDVRLIPLDGAK